MNSKDSKGVNPASKMVGSSDPWTPGRGWNAHARSGCTERSSKAMRPRASCRCTRPSPGNRRHGVPQFGGFRCQGWIGALSLARCLWDAATSFLGDLEVLEVDLMTTSFFQLAGIGGLRPRISKYSSRILRAAWWILNVLLGCFRPSSQARKIYVQHRIVEATKNAPPRMRKDGFKKTVDFVVS